MAKTNYLWNGTVKWAKVQNPAPKYNPEEGNEYSLNFYPGDDATRKEIVGSGIKNKQKEDDDGFYFTFRTDDKPYVFNEEGEFSELVGNGSGVTIKVEVDSFKSKKYGPVVRATLKAVRIDDLVPYEEDTDDTDEEFKGPAIPF